MRVERLRPLPSPEQLTAMYPVPHDHRLYGRGHGERVEATIALALEHIGEPDRCEVADLSCGNGEIARRICSYWEGNRLHLGDMAGLPRVPGVGGAMLYHGPIEQTILGLPDAIDTFVLSETIEHLDDPGAVLALARSKSARLLLSTPLECWDDGNGEHLWAWDREGVEDLLMRTGWEPAAFTSVDSREYGEPYWFGIWVCS